MTTAPPAATETFRGRGALVVCHVAGMLDLVVLPLWIGAMMQTHAFAPQQAGALVTLFILGVLGSSLFFAPRFPRLRARWAAALGYGVAALGFGALSQLSDFASMAGLHLLTGVATGCGLSFTHGTIGRSANPHRLFAIAGLGVSVFAVAFFGGMPALLAEHGAPVLFLAIAALVAVAALAAALAFPELPSVPAPATVPAAAGPVAANAPAFSWTPVVLLSLAIGCFNTTQSMAFAFAERIGVGHGFEPSQVALPFLVGGLINIAAPILAGLLQKRLVALYAALGAIAAHAVLAVMITTSTSYLGFAIGVALLPFMIIFGHNFVFGMLARIDTSGRATALTPAMLMLGAAIGPLLGGTLAQAFGYPSLAVAGVASAAIGIALFLATARLVPSERGRPAPGLPAHAH